MRAAASRRHPAAIDAANACTDWRVMSHVELIRVESIISSLPELELIQDGSVKADDRIDPFFNIRNR